MAVLTEVQSRMRLAPSDEMLAQRAADKKLIEGEAKLLDERRELATRRAEVEAKVKSGELAPAALQAILEQEMRLINISTRIREAKQRAFNSCPDMAMRVRYGELQASKRLTDQISRMQSDLEEAQFRLREYEESTAKDAERVKEGTSWFGKMDSQQTKDLAQEVQHRHRMQQRDKLDIEELQRRIVETRAKYDADMLELEKVREKMIYC